MTKKNTISCAGKNHISYLKGSMLDGIQNDSDIRMYVMVCFSLSKK